MKLRIRGDSLRFRLTQSEVKLIARGLAVTEKTHFSKNQTLTYTLEPSAAAKEPEALFLDNHIRVLIPQGISQSWATTEQVEIQFMQKPSADSDPLFLLIEKDFACLKPRKNELEDESDMFTNPNEAHGKCR